MKKIVFIFAFLILTSGTANALSFAYPSDLTINIGGIIEYGYLISPLGKTHYPNPYRIDDYRPYFDIAGLPFIGTLYFEYNYREFDKSYLTSQIWAGDILLEPFDPFFVRVYLNDPDKESGLYMRWSDSEMTSTIEIKLNYYQNGAYNDSFWLEQGDQHAVGTWDIRSSLFAYHIESSPNPVPEPSSFFLFGTGLIGFAGWGRKKFRKR